ncbi:MAG: hypothetical protein GEU28_12210 [Dehalococcoidia bacterium]|nr:hypothetical protein [Dehalococcoidia bacterium]
MQPARYLNEPLGAGGDWRRRLLLHHAPLALASIVVLMLFMSLSPFKPDPPADIFSGTFPKEFSEGGAIQHTGPPQQQGQDHQIPQQHGGGQTGPMEAGEMGGMSSPSLLGISVRQFTFATGYVATGLLALTLLIGPGKLLLRRRNPVSDYLTRDVGTWAAIGSVVHVIFGLEVHSKILDPLPMFVQDGSPLTNSFWPGELGLLAISNDFAVRKLKARTWKNLQRLNYALIALVIAHAFFYGVLLRTGSPYTLLLFVSVVAVFVGQAVGVWLWRRRHSRTTARLAGATG